MKEYIGREFDVHAFGKRMRVVLELCEDGALSFREVGGSRFVTVIESEMPKFGVKAFRHMGYAAEWHAWPQQVIRVTDTRANKSVLVWRDDWEMRAKAHCRKGKPIHEWVMQRLAQDGVDCTVEQAIAALTQPEGKRK